MGKGQRHSKNAGVMGSEGLTYHERRALGFGTVKERLGKVCSRLHAFMHSQDGHGSGAKESTFSMHAWCRTHSATSTTAA